MNALLWPLIWIVMLLVAASVVERWSTRTVDRILKALGA